MIHIIARRFFKKFKNDKEILILKLEQAYMYVYIILLLKDLIQFRQIN